MELATGAGTSLVGNSTNHNRLQELKAFDESKAGVKGLVDSGITHVPRIFIRPPKDLATDPPIPCESTQLPFKIPVINLARKRSDVVVSKDMVAAARDFHELPKELKGEYYTREKKKKVTYGSNFDLFRSKYASWRDTLCYAMGPETLHP
ncbi:hypothetical protein RJT34_02381 [Clitoria ternatea]|uniref:Uncharacterized protein n=1 Tax=Clitoria ternatea TaxID=43366 RepID=A0AAN9KHP8_CLITE